MVQRLAAGSVAYDLELQFFVDEAKKKGKDTIACPICAVDVEIPASGKASSFTKNQVVEEKMAELS